MNYVFKIFILVGCLCCTTTTWAQLTTKLPKPGQVNIAGSQTLNVTNIKEGGHIQVTAPQYDNIGQILTKIDFKYQSYNPAKNPYMIFINCGTPTSVKPADLNDYVSKGGILYASDLTDKLLTEAFPNLFVFKGRVGKAQEMTATVEDSELQSIIGSQMEVHFDLNSWAVLEGVNAGKVLLRSNQTGLPLMVEVPYGKGRIFYTCFHNHKQASEKEEALIKLLIAKQVNALVDQDFAYTAEQMGLNLKQMKLMFAE